LNSLNRFKTFLSDVLRARASAVGLLWLEKALAAVATNERVLLRYYTEASRVFGKAALSLNNEERSALATFDSQLILDSWALDDASRALLLIAASEQLSRDEFCARARRCYELGDSREQQSWLRGLAVLPYGESFEDLAVDSCRTNILHLFEAIATNNPYPARHFPELNFNQMVMKCLFNGVPLAKVVALDARLNPELQRMAESYASERTAAGRTVPADIARTTYENV
jgi:hypothetical protein